MILAGNKYFNMLFLPIVGLPREVSIVLQAVLYRQALSLKISNWPMQMFYLRSTRNMQLSLKNCAGDFVVS